MASAKIEVLLLQGPVTVAYRREGRKWHATVLQFDLVGIGKTPQAAFNELQGVVNTYLQEILKTKGPVRLFNPSEPCEWESPRRESYHVAIAAVKSGGARRVPRPVRNADDLRRLRNRIAGFNLVPAAASA